MKYIKDLSGKIFGDWAVLEFGRVADCGSVYWKCECSCGNVVQVQSGHLKSGVSSKCKLCSNREKALARKKTDLHYANRLVYNRYKISAKMMNLGFKINIDEFSFLIHENCAYCGSAPSNEFRIKRSSSSKILLYNGIDRVDSSKGYILENCVSCCFQCNRSKNSLTNAQFLSWIESVYNKMIAEGKIICQKF